MPAESILSVSLDESLEAPAKFAITLNEGLDINTQEFLWLDSELIDPGNKVDIYFGYAGKEKKHLFTGTIKVLTPGFQATGIPGLTVEGFDLSHAMQKGTTDFNGKDVKYSDIAAEIAGKYHLQNSGVEKGERKKDEKDYAFLRRRAEDENFEFFAQGETLYFRKPKDDQDPVRTYQYRKNFVSFNPRLSLAALVYEVIVTGWDVKTKKSIKESVPLSEVVKDSETVGMLKKFIESAEGLDPKKIESKVLKSKEEAKKKGIVALRKSVNTFIQGDLECIGDPELRVGNSVEIKGTGKLFSGNYYITTVKHSFSDSGYKTTLGVRRTLV